MANMHALQQKARSSDTSSTSDKLVCVGGVLRQAFVRTSDTSPFADLLDQLAKLEPQHHQPSPAPASPSSPPRLRLRT